jgi:ankyrin repeat protein
MNEISSDEDEEKLDVLYGSMKRLEADICEHNQSILYERATNTIYNCRLCFLHRSLLNAMECHKSESFVDIVRRLSYSGAQEITDKRGFTPFLCAVECNDTKAMMELKELFNVNARAKSKKGNLAIHIAAKNGCWKAIKKLILRFEFKVEETNDSGATPLRVAVEHRQDELITHLVKKLRVKVNTDLYGYVDRVVR